MYFHHIYHNPFLSGFLAIAKKMPEKPIVIDAVIRITAAEKSPADKTRD